MCSNEATKQLEHASLKHKPIKLTRFGGNSNFPVQLYALVCRENGVTYYASKPLDGEEKMRLLGPALLKQFCVLGRVGFFVRRAHNSWRVECTPLGPR